MKIMSFAPVESTLSLESHLDRIALESGVLANLIETFKTSIPSFLGKIKAVNAQLVNTSAEQDDIGIKLSSKERNAIEASRHISYINFGARLISVPENFKGNLVLYAKVLNQITTDLYQMQNTILPEYNAILASFLTNKEDKISLKDHTAFFSRINNEREGFVKQLAEFTNQKSGVSKVRFKDAMERMADMEPLLKETARLSRSHSRAKLQQINDVINHSVDLLDMIVQGVQSGSITNISPNATMNIAKGAYEVAKYVELVGVVYFDVTVLLNTVDGLLDTLININNEI